MLCTPVAVATGESGSFSKDGGWTKVGGVHHLKTSAVAATFVFFEREAAYAGSHGNLFTPCGLWGGLLLGVTTWPGGAAKTCWWAAGALGLVAAGTIRG